MKLTLNLLFFMISTLFLIAQFWISGPWPMFGFFYTALVGWAWYQIPRSFQASEPTLAESFPLLMLILFLMILCAAPHRSTSEALFFTAAGLISFRIFTLILKRVQTSRNAIPKVIQGLMLGLLIEILVNAIQVYSTFRPVSPTTLYLASQIQIRALMAAMTVGWVIDTQFNSREKKVGSLLALGLIGNPIVAGTALIVNGCLMLVSPKPKA
jgi:hypothetical protein